MKVLLFVFNLFIGTTLLAQSFTEEAGNLFEGVIDGSIAFTDADGDDDHDLILTGQNSSTAPNAKLYLNDGNGNFIESIDVPFDQVRNSSIAILDVDSDKDQDVLITGINKSFSRIAKLYLNDGNGNYLESMEDSFTGVQDGAIAVADVDGDNDQDILITGRSNPALPSSISSKLYMNDGNGNFSERMDTPFEGVFNGSIAFADIDGDDDQDVVITGENNSDVSISKLYKNNGAGTYIEDINTPFAGVRNSAIAFADIDSDNDLDLLITGWNSVGFAKLYLNDGTGNYNEKIDENLVGITAGDIAFADVDNDGDQDLVTTGSSQSGKISKLYLNDGSGSFFEFSNSFDMVWLSSIAFADVDGDNDQDLLITGENDSNQRISKLYKNGLMTSSIDFTDSKTLDAKVYPNPASTPSVFINYNASESGKLNVEMINIIGCVIYKMDYRLKRGEQTFSLDINSIPNGYYLLHLKQGDKISQKKLIIK